MNLEQQPREISRFSEYLRNYVVLPNRLVPYENQSFLLARFPGWNVSCLFNCSRFCCFRTCVSQSALLVDWNLLITVEFLSLSAINFWELHFYCLICVFSPHFLPQTNWEKLLIKVSVCPSFWKFRTCPFEPDFVCVTRVHYCSPHVDSRINTFLTQQQQSGLD